MKMKLRKTMKNDLEMAMGIIDGAKKHLKEQGIDQWQSGYPDYACIEKDTNSGKGYFVFEENQVLGYLCIDFDGEPAYDKLDGEWSSDKPYVVVHRMAFHENARGKRLADVVFQLVEELSREKGIHNFRVDTDADNEKMQHILKKNGFSYRGKIWFDNSEKIAFDKIL